MNCNEWVTLRAKPSTSANTVTRIPWGDTVEAYAYNSQFAECYYNGLHGYVLLKYFGILSWFQGHGTGVKAMRLIHKRYADRQGILAELTVFEDSEDGEYMKKLRRFFARFGYEEEAFGYRLGGAAVTLTVKPIRGTAEIAPVARRMITDFYSRCLRPAQLEKMLDFQG